MPIYPNVRVNRQDPYNSEYIINMINNDLTKQEATAKVSYIETRNMPFLSNPSDYYIAVSSFSLETPSLPIFIPAVAIGQSNINKLIYVMKVGYNGNFVQANVTYEPENKLVSLPQPPTIIQDLESEYYNIYTFQHWVYLLNNTLSTLLAQLNAIAVLPTSVKSFFEYDVNSGLIKFYAPQGFYEETLATPITVNLNNSLQTLLDSLPVYYKTVDSVPMYQIRILPNSKQENYNANTYVSSIQSSTTIGLLCPVRSVVFTSSILAVNSASVTPPQIFNSNSQLYSSGNNAGLANILTEFSVPISTPQNTYKESVDYKPSEYKWIDMKGQNPINNLEISAMWKDRYGNLRPFKLNSGCCCNINLYFRRRDFWNVTL